MTDSLTWWRRTTPARGSMERVRLGKTQNHPSSRLASGYFRSTASGTETNTVASGLFLDQASLQDELRILLQ